MIKSSSIDYMLRQQEEDWERMQREQAKMQEEQARLQEEQNARVQESEAIAQEDVQEAAEQSKAGAESGAAASQAAAAEAHASSVPEESAEEGAEAEESGPKEPVAEGGKVKIGPTNRPFTEEQSFLLHQREAVRDTKTRIVERGELGDLGENDEMKAIRLFEHSGVANHPGDKGMKAIAERIAAALIPLLRE